MYHQYQNVRMKRVPKILVIARSKIEMTKSLFVSFASIAIPFRYFKNFPRIGISFLSIGSFQYFYKFVSEEMGKRKIYSAKLYGSHHACPI